ncbi:MAG: helix-turn-helix transcriptional regulator [Planctomycetia bacterium]|nr:helix-turn-helix transcriptional regulator [Planctomycetia bacterium]
MAADNETRTKYPNLRYLSTQIGIFSVEVDRMKKNTEFGRNLLRIRLEKGMTQKELADKAGLNTNALAKLERGVNEPGWPVVLAVCAALGVSCSAFGGLAEESTVPAAEQKRGRGRPKKGSDTPEGKGKAK